MHGAAGRVEQLEGARVADAGLAIAPFLRRDQQVLAEVTQARLPVGGVEPEAAQGVVDQELDHVARGEELIAHRQFAAGARRLAGLAHRLALFLGVEVLVDPADGFVLAPQRGEVGGVDQVQHLEQGGLAGKKAPLGGVAVEQGRQVLGQFIEDAEQIDAIGIAGLPQGGAGQAGVKLEALGLEAVAHRFDQQAPRLSHAQGGQAVEHGEGLLAEDAVQPLGGVAITAGGVMGQGVAQDAGGFALGVVDVAQAGQCGDGARLRVHAVVVLKLAGELLLQHAARVGNEALETAAGGLVKGHELACSRVVAGQVTIERPDQHARQGMTSTGPFPFLNDGKVAEADTFGRFIRCLIAFRIVGKFFQPGRKDRAVRKIITHCWLPNVFWLTSRGLAACVLRRWCGA